MFHLPEPALFAGKQGLKGFVLSLKPVEDVLPLLERREWNEELILQ